MKWSRGSELDHSWIPGPIYEINIKGVVDCFTHAIKHAHAPPAWRCISALCAATTLDFLGTS